MSIKEPKARTLECLRCDGKGYILEEYADADMREKFRKKICRGCNGKKVITIPCTHED